jgi:tRNA(His) guanylyltransferase
MPHFDARVFQLPSKDEAANAFLWRAMDARKNAISMVAQSRVFSQGAARQGSEGHAGDAGRAGVDFEAYPPAFRRGSFVRRECCQRTC